GGEEGEGRGGVQAWGALWGVGDRVRVAINRDLQREVGLTLAENLVLCHVAMAPGRRLRMVDIAAMLTIGKSAVTKTVDRLEERGLIARERASEDRRTVYATLTADGEKAFAAAQPAFAGAVRRHSAGRVGEAGTRRRRRLRGRVLRGSAAGR